MSEEHVHAWEPRSDLGRARYACACGMHGKRKGANIVERNPPREAQTVRFKSYGSSPATEHEDACDKTRSFWRRRG